MERIFLYTVAGLEFAAVGVYYWNGSIRSAIIWACYAAATIALAGGVTR